MGEKNRRKGAATLVTRGSQFQSGPIKCGRRGPVPKVRSETLNSLLERSLILQDPIRPPLVRRVFSAVSPSVLSLIGDDLVANGDRMMIDVAV